MNSCFRYIFPAVVCILALALISGAVMADDSGRRGELIHTSTVDGYELAYHLIDMHGAGAKMEAKDSLGGQKPTHHLMLYVSAPGGQTVDQARTGFLIQGPDDTTQKVMAMAMSGGYGADISLQVSGEYTIKAKVVSGEKSLIDGFNYQQDEQ
jgi:hypothetical protein